MEISINGPKILYTIPVLGGINITESVVNSWVVLLIVFVLCKIMTRKLTVHNPSKIQVGVEKLVLMANNLVNENMGEKFSHFTCFVTTILVYSFCSSLLSITGLRSPTADFSVCFAMAVVVFFVIEYFKIKTNGFFGFLKGFTEPIFLMTPMNILGEFSTPLSMSFRHYGNISSGVIISTLIYVALGFASKFILGWIPSTFIASIPILQAGVPAILSLYFDLFTSAMQAYIFCMLTMAFIKGATE